MHSLQKVKNKNPEACSKGRPLFLLVLESVSRLSAAGQPDSDGDQHHTGVSARFAQLHVQAALQSAARLQEGPAHGLLTARWAGPDLVSVAFKQPGLEPFFELC